jgi:acyl carrier protein
LWGTELIIMKDRFIDLFKEALEMDEDREIYLTDNFRDYDEWDSLSRLSLIVMLDEEFSVEIENEDFEKIKSLGDLLKEVEKRQKA